MMRSTNPTEQKSYGKQVAGFNLVEWRKEVPDMLKKGLKTKFTQVESCRESLKATGTWTIIEANPNDGYYGIAKSLNEKDIWDSSKWSHNLLGKVLMEVRSEL